MKSLRTASLAHRDEEAKNQRNRARVEAVSR
jgi:hypothetical protein